MRKPRGSSRAVRPMATPTIAWRSSSTPRAASRSRPRPRRRRSTARDTRCWWTRHPRRSPWWRGWSRPGDRAGPWMIPAGKMVVVGTDGVVGPIQDDPPATARERLAHVQPMRRSRHRRVRRGRRKRVRGTDRTAEGIRPGASRGRFPRPPPGRRRRPGTTDEGRRCDRRCDRRWSATGDGTPPPPPPNQRPRAGFSGHRAARTSSSACQVHGLRRTTPTAIPSRGIGVSVMDRRSPAARLLRTRMTIPVATT